MPSIPPSLWQVATIIAAVALVALLACGGGSETSSDKGPAAAPFAGIHTYTADTAAQGTSPMTTPAVATPGSGSLILVQVLTQSTATFQGLSDNKGNVYVNVGGPQAYARNNVAGSYLYVAENAAGGPGHSWSLTKTAGNENHEATLFVVVFPAGSAVRSLGAWSYANTARYSGTAIATTVPNSEVVSFFGPADYSGSVNDYTPPAGWTRLDQVPYSNNHNSGADAVVAMPAGGTIVNPTWSVAHSFETGSSLWLVEIK